MEAVHSASTDVSSVQGISGIKYAPFSPVLADSSGRPFGTRELRYVHVPAEPIREFRITDRYRVSGSMLGGVAGGSMGHKHAPMKAKIYRLGQSGDLSLATTGLTSRLEPDR